MAEIYFKKENGVFAASVVNGGIKCQIAIPSGDKDHPSVDDKETEKGLKVLWVILASMGGEEEADRQMEIMKTEFEKRFQ